MDILTYLATLKFLLIDLLYTIFWKLFLADKYKRLRKKVNIVKKGDPVDEWISAMTTMQRQKRRKTNFYVFNEENQVSSF